MPFHRIQTEIVGRVGVVTINRPPANALGSQTNEEIEEAIRLFLEIAEVKVIIITGMGKYFAAGADILELRDLNSTTAGELVQSVKKLYIILLSPLFAR